MKLRFMPCLGLAFAALAAQAQGRYVIEGSVGEAPKGTVVLLFRDEGTMGMLIAKDTLRAGKFRFEGETIGNGTDNLSLATQYGDTGSMCLRVYVRPGSRVKITSDDMFVYTWNVESDVPEQLEAQKLIDPVRDLWREVQRIDYEEESVKAQLKAKGLAKDEKSRLKAQRDSLKKASRKLNEEIVLRESKAMADIQVSDQWMLNLLNNAYMAKLSEREDLKNCVKALYDQLPEKWRNTPYGREAGTVIYPPVQAKAGDVIEDCELYDLDGNVHHLSDFRGKYVLMDFWSYGCGACRMAIPELKEVAEMYKDSVAVISMSLDNDKMWREATDVYGVTGNNLNERKGRSGIAAKFGIYSIPLFVLLSPQGTFIEKWAGYGKGDLKERVAKLFSSK